MFIYTYIYIYTHNTYMSLEFLRCLMLDSFPDHTAPGLQTPKCLRCSVQCPPGSLITPGMRRHLPGSAVDRLHVQVRLHRVDHASTMAEPCPTTFGSEGEGVFCKQRIGFMSSRHNPTRNFNILERRGLFSMFFFRCWGYSKWLVAAFAPLVAPPAKF